MLSLQLKGMLYCKPCMEQLNRLDWNGSIAFTSHGARIGIRVNDPAYLRDIQSCFPPGWKPLSEPLVDFLYSFYVGPHSTMRSLRHYHLLYLGTDRLARTIELNEVFEALESMLHFNVAVKAQRRIFVHAGVVGWQGAALVLPGRSMAGKTTLVAELVRAGATYYSDEYAVFDHRGRVHPYARPLVVRGNTNGQRKKVGAEELGGHAGSKPLPVKLIVLTTFRGGARWRPDLLSPAQSLLTLINNTVVARVKPAMALKFLHSVASQAITLKSRRGEVEETVPRLLELMATAQGSQTVNNGCSLQSLNSKLQSIC